MSTATDLQVKVTGIAWYRREDYDRLRAMFIDGDKLPPTFESWSKAAENLYNKLTAERHAVVKAYIDPETFPDWCEARNLTLDAKGRMAYGNECAAKKYTAQ